MLQEEIARLTGTLKFNVEARPLVAFEKRLNGVMNLLREFSTIANKKFTVKVALDSRSLRAQIDRATKAKISLTNIDVSNEALAAQSKRIQEYLDKTPIRLSNVKVDISKLVDQKRFVKTLMGQMQIDMPIKLGLSAMEAELRREVKIIGERNPIKVSVEISHNQLVQKLRRAMIQAQKNIGALKIRVAEPEVRLKVDKQHLIAEIRAAIQSEQFDIRIGARRHGGGGSRGEGGGGRSQVDRGLSSAMGFARGALPGLGAAFAVSQLNDISQKVIAATNSLHAVSGDEQTFKSNENFLNNLAKEQGLTLRSIMPQYSSIYQAAAPAIGVKGTQDMFRGITKYGTVHGIDKEAMKGSMVALSQMFGKDKIQAEEARQQFSERMPGGMALLAKAAGTDVKGFSEMMQKGKADPKKILPELGRLMEELADKNDAYAKSLETTRVAQGRMNYQFERSVMLFSEGGFDRGMKSFFTEMTDGLERAGPLIKALGTAFEYLIKPVNSIIRLIGMLGENWEKFSNALGVSQGALATIAAAIGIFMLPFGGFIAAVAAAALVLDDLFTYMRDGKSVFGQMVAETPGAQDQIDALSQSFDHLVNALSEIGISFDGLKTKYQDVFGNVKTENPFVVVLRTMSELVDNIASGLDRIAAILRGDFQAGFKGLGNAYKEHVIDRFPGVKLAKYALGEGEQLLNGFRTHETMPVPSPLMTQSARQPAMTAPNITIPSITLQVKAPEGVTDPKEFANGMAPHIQELTYKAIQDAFGAARAQQAEVQ
jgi:tape measure domain-containing protein